MPEEVLMLLLRVCLYMRLPYSLLMLACDFKGIIFTVYLIADDTFAGCLV